MQQQQSPESSKNFILFLIITFLILGGWMALQSYLAPRPQENQEKKAAKKDKKDQPWPAKLRKAAEPCELIALLSPQVPLSPLQAAFVQTSALQWFVPSPKTVWPAKLRKAAEPCELIALLSPKVPLSPLQAAFLQTTAFQWFAPPAKKNRPTPSIPIDVVELGKPDWFLHAILTNRGAGVQKLTLTKFKAADWFGEPKYLKKKPAPLILIQEDPVNPSFRMYHYPDPDEAKEFIKEQRGLTDEEKKALTQKMERPLTILGQRNWILESNKKDKDVQTVVFTTPGPPGWEQLQIRKTFTLRKKWYHIGLKIEIIDDGDENVERKPFRYQLAGAHGMPIEGAWYTYVHRNAMIGEVDASKVLRRSLQQSQEASFWEGGNKFPPTHPTGHLVPYAAVVTQYFASAIAVDVDQQEGVEQESIIAYARPTNESRERPCIFNEDLGGDKVRVTFTDDDVQPTRILRLLRRARKELDDKKIKPAEKIVADLYPYYEDGEQKWIVGRLRRGTAVMGQFEDLTVRAVSEPVTTSAKRTVAHQFVLYNGPVKIRQLGTLGGDETVDYKLVEKYAAALHLESLTDYPSVPWMSLLSELYIIIIKIMHWLLDRLYWLVSWLPYPEALAIVLLIIMVRGAMFPVSLRQQRMSIKMQQLAPEMKKLREELKDDPQKMQKEIWALYRKHGANPIGGCLPMFLQLPIFIGLYYSLQESIRFRLASFLWIDNLAAPDMLFSWGQGLPWISSPDALGTFIYLGPYFNLLPIVAVVIMLMHQKLMMPPPTDEQQEMQQKMMKYMMIVFGLMFYKVAAGLCTYFIASSLWGMAERQLLPKKKKAADGKTEPPKTSTNNVPEKKIAKQKQIPPSVRRKERKKQRGKQPEKPKSFMERMREQWDELLKQAKKK